MFSKFIPQSISFFDFLDRHIAITLKAAEELHVCISNSNELLSTSHIKTREHEADHVAKECVTALYKTFITPIDRDQIHSLMTAMDDIIDHTYAAANYLQVYKIKIVKNDFRALLEILIKSVKLVQQAINGLRNLKQGEKLFQICHAINTLEQNADDAFRIALGRLFEDELDATQIIKWKDLYTSLEMATDHCYEVAKMIERIVLENE